MPCIATAAMAKAIVARGGYYVLAVKENQPALLEDAKAAIRAAKRRSKTSLTTADAAHGRNEKRVALVASVPGMPKSTTFLASRLSPLSPASAALTKRSSATS